MGFYDMHIYDVKMGLRDTFYGEPSVLFGTPHQDACALAALSRGVLNLCARNRQYYWYFFLKDDKDRDLVRFLLRRNGLRPEFHMSKYYDYDNKQPAFRVQMTVLNKSKFLSEFAQMVKVAYSDDQEISSAVMDYIDIIRTKFNNNNQKKK